MKFRACLAILLMLTTLLAGCQRENGEPEVTTRPADVEPTATYDWMAGDSPVSVRRIGADRFEHIGRPCAVSPTGVYYLYNMAYQLGRTPPSPVIVYVDHGSDTVIRLCGRADCTHDTTDCNSYVEGGIDISYYRGYLYAVSFYQGNLSDPYSRKVYRMEPDGSNRVVAFDMQKFVEENGFSGVQYETIVDGYLLFNAYEWAKNDAGELVSGEQVGYMYKLDGSMGEPKRMADSAGILCCCGDVNLTLEVEDGAPRAYHHWDPETDTLQYLTDYPDTPGGWFGREEAYYFKDGAVIRRTYATGAEEAVIDTGLEGRYRIFCFPDCIMLVSSSLAKDQDRNLYFYNWAFEPVDTVLFDVDGFSVMWSAVLTETADRIILAADGDGYPVLGYYIEKSELGTGDAKLHEYDLSDFNDLRSVLDMF